MSTAEVDARAKAAEYRRAHGLSDTQPIGDLPSLIDLLEEIDVAVVPSPDPEGHGLTITDPTSGITVITAAVTDNPLRLRSTLAHELAHRVFGDAIPESGRWVARSMPEQRADAFARNLLLPLAALPERLGSPGDPDRPEVSEESLSDLVQWFEISPAMVAIQLAYAGYITQKRKNEWMALSGPRLATRYGWMSLYHSWRTKSRTVLPPQRLLSLATEGYVQGVVSVDALARIQHVPVAQVLEDLQEAGVVVNPPRVEIADIDDFD